MAKYLIELNDPTTGDMALLQLHAESLDEAKGQARGMHPTYEVVKVKHTHGGKRTDSGRVSKWGDGVATDRRRLPVKYSQQAEAVIGELEMVNHILDSWQSKVDESKGKSASGQPSERYKYVAQLVTDLKQAMQITGGKLM